MKGSDIRLDIRRFLITGIGLFLICATAIAQTFMKTYGSAGINEGGQAIAASPDGNFFIGGNSGDSALVMKVDPTGEVIWARTFRAGPTHQDLIYQLAVTPDGYLIGSGERQPNSYPPYAGLFYFKFDLAGNMIWMKVSTDTRPVYCRAIIPRSSSEYVLSCVIFDQSSATFTDPIQIGVSALDGSTLWTGPRYDYMAGSGYLDEVLSGTLGDGQTSYTTGRIYVDGGNPGSMRPFISQYDPNGLIIWSKYYVANSIADARIYGADIIYDNNSLTLTYYGDINQYSSSFQIGLIHTDTLGNFMWGNNYQITSFTSEESSKVLKMPYGYAIVGFGAGGGNDLFVIAVTEQGELIWAKSFGSSTTTENLAITSLRNAVAFNGDVLLTGRTINSADADLILVRVDENGVVACGPSNDLSVVTTAVPSFTESLSPSSITDNIPFQSISSVSTSVITDQCTDPGPFLGSDSTSCSTITLSAPSLGSGTTYYWENGMTGPNHTITTPGTYWVTATVNCCTFSDTILVLPGSTPVPAFATNSSACSQTVAFTNASSNSFSYFWDFGDNQTSTEEQPTHDYSAGGTYDITLTATNDCGTNDTTIQVVIHTPGTFSISGPDTLCADQDGAFTSSLTGAIFSSIAWSSGADSSSILFASSTSTILYALATDSNNCTYSDTLQIHIPPNPVAGFTFNTQPCDTVVIFSDGSNEATSWHWDLGNGESSNLPSPSGHYPDFGTYIIQQIAYNACGSDTVAHPLSLGPSGTLALAGPDSLCANETGTYSINLQGAGIANVQWSLAASDSTIIALNLSNNSILGVTVLGSDGCIYQDSMVIQVLPLPTASFAALADPCDSTAAFMNTSQHADTYAWEFGNGETSNAPSPTSYFDPSVNHVVILVAINGCGSDTAQQALVFDTVPQLLLVGPTYICSDKPVEFHLAYSGADLHGLHWSTGDTTASIIISTVDGEIIQVAAIDDHGCLLGSSYLVQYVGDGGIGSAYIPNVFTPNSDGVNESFAPVIQLGFVSMEIFNRWGQEIFETTDINKPWRGDRNGAPVHDGTYVYIVKWHDQCTGMPESRIGHVTLLR